MGADYAEYFEWADGNPENEDRRGMLVSLDGDRIVPANDDDITGVVSACPSVVGNAAELCWRGKYERDAFGSVITDENGAPVISENWSNEKAYIPRSERPEWAAVGLVGRLVVTDNGSCKVGGYCTARGGIAQITTARTNIRVLKRIDETHIEVLIR